MSQRFFLQKTQAIKMKNGKLLIGFGFFLSILFFQGSGTLAKESKESFDINSILPGCKPGVYNCGEQPESREELDAVPKASRKLAARSSLPSHVDLSPKFPPIGSQGQQGSCVGWSSTYAVHSYLMRLKNGWSSYGTTGGADKACHKGYTSGASKIFSPAWTYNQINGGRDNGSSRLTALKLMRDQGAVSCEIMPYNVKDYLTQPTHYMKQSASDSRIKDYERVDLSDTRLIKEKLAEGFPLLCGVKVNTGMYNDFLSKNKYIWDQTVGAIRGGHAMAMVGYDDTLVSSLGHRGAFKIQNSWGSHYGKNGFLWISYKYLPVIGISCYVVYVDKGQGQQNEPVATTTISSQISAPSSVRASSGTYKGQITVQWSSVDMATNYQVERRSANETSFTQLAYTDGTNYTDSHVQNNLTYYYRIIAISNAGRSNAADSPVAEGFALEKENKVPSAVTNLSAAASVVNSRPQVQLTWNASNEANQYLVVRYDASRKSWIQLTKVSTTYYFDSRPLNGWNYYYVRPMNSTGSGPWGDMARVYITQSSGNTSVVTTQKPSKVANLSVSQGTYSDKIVLNWSQVPGAISYYILRYDVASRAWNKNFTTNTTSFSDTQISAGQQYFYTVKAYNRAGYSNSWSEVLRGYTGQSADFNWRSSILPAPQKVSVQSDSFKGLVMLRWKPVRGAKGYEIWRKPEKDRFFQKVKRVEANVLTYKDSLDTNQSGIYFYQVVTISALNLPSKDPVTVTGFVNAPIYKARTVFDPAQGLHNFRGEWTAVLWEPGKKPETIRIAVSEKSKDFMATIQISRKKSTISGQYAAKSRYLVTPGFSFELLEQFQNDIATVVIDLPKVWPRKIELNFTRPNQDTRR